MRLTLSIIFGTILLAMLYVLYLLPLPTTLQNIQIPRSTRILDRQGRLLYELPVPDFGHRTYVKLADIPTDCVQATLAAEDKNYFSHLGVDGWGVLRALYNNLSQGEIVTGGSTITTQLIKNILGTNFDRTWSNKLYETILAFRLNQVYSKDQVLEWYLNYVYYGNLFYGMPAAAQGYFGKNIWDLDTAECALLAGIPQSPNRHNPWLHPEDATQRQQQVLKQMQTTGYLSPTGAAAAAEEKLNFRSSDTTIRAPHFVFYVLSELEKTLPTAILYNGLDIYTTLDLDWQTKAEQIVRERLTRLAGHDVGNAAAIILQNNGQVLAYVGSADYNAPDYGAVNILTARRQPGSTLKPFVYLLGVMKGLTAATVINDVPISFKTETGETYAPKNFDFKYHGPVFLREALGNSLNIPAVRVAEKVGLNQVIALAEKLGISTWEQSSENYGLALALGDAEVRLQELTMAYTMLANRGRQPAWQFIDHLEGATFDPPEPPQRIIATAYVDLINQILGDNDARLMSFGERNPLRTSYYTGVKTGTTRNFRDNLTIGFSTRYTVGVWVGNNDNTPMREVTGITGAAPIWRDLMDELHRGLATSRLDYPSVHWEKADICRYSGLLPGPYCLEQRHELFIPGTVPREQETLWRQENGRACFAFQGELRTWAQQQGWPLCLSINNDQHIISPQDGERWQRHPDLSPQFSKMRWQSDCATNCDTQEWWLNNELIGRGQDYYWSLTPGHYTLELRQDNITKESVTFDVVD